LLLVSDPIDAQEAFQTQRSDFIEDITTLTQDAAMNFGTLNDNLDRLLDLVSLKQSRRRRCDDKLQYPVGF
jgi:hypothetical protein